MEENPEEVWKDIPGYEGLYQVSNLGRVRSLPRVSRFIGRWGTEVRRAAPGKVLAARVKESDHRYVGLCKEGEIRNRHIHDLVLTAFVSPRPDGMECLHGDGDPSNNRLENLRWGTSSENKLDSVRHGTHPNARKTHCKHGHEFTPGNTYLRPGGGRKCRTCKNLQMKRAYHQRKLYK